MCSKVVNSNELGFTFIEVIAAIAIMAVALIPIISIFPNVLFISKQVEHVTKATFLAEEKMEEVRNEMLSVFNQDYGESYAFPVPDSAYKCIVSDNMNPDLKNITVTVWYDEDDDWVVDDDEDKVRLDTKIADKH